MKCSDFDFNSARIKSMSSIIVLVTEVNSLMMQLYLGFIIIHFLSDRQSEDAIII